jgi:hypothetical protein
MAGVDHRPGINPQRPPLEAAGVRVKAPGGGKPAELRAQFGPFVGDQSGIQPPGGRGARPAVQHHPDAAAGHQQPGRAVGASPRRPHPRVTSRIQPAYRRSLVRSMSPTHGPA